MAGWFRREGRTDRGKWGGCLVAEGEACGWGEKTGRFGEGKRRRPWERENRLKGGSCVWPVRGERGRRCCFWLKEKKERKGKGGAG